MSTLLALIALEERAVLATADSLPVLPAIDGVMQVHLQQVAALGRHLGNREDVFAKIGDSNTHFPEFVTALGQPGYNAAKSGLADRPNLIDTWVAYHTTPATGGINSFARSSIASRAGYSSPDLQRNVTVELATIRPAVAIIMIGTNDIGTIGRLDVFRGNLRQVIDTCLATGVIPVVSTIPDLLLHADWSARVAQYNQAIADVAAEAEVPLWNFHRQTTELPNRGLRDDRIHLSISPNGSGQLGDADLAYGANLRNRTTLEVLEKVRSIVFQNATPDGDVPPTATTWVPLNVGDHPLAVGSGAGRGNEVVLFDSITHSLLTRLVPHESSFRGGVNVAVGDVTGDAVPDVVTGPGLGGGPVVKIFSGTDGQLVRTWSAYEESFRGGVNVAVGDVTGDGVADVAVGAGVGGGPRVRVFDGRDGTSLADYFAFESSFRDGVNVAIASGESPTLLATPGVGGGPLLAVFDPLTGRRLSALFAFDANLRGGLSVAAGDVTGDGQADWVVGAGVGSGPVVRVFDPVARTWLNDEIAFDPESRAGVRVAVTAGRVVTGRGFREGSGVQLDDNLLMPFGDFRGGVFVGG